MNTPPVITLETRGNVGLIAFHRPPANAYDLVFHRQFNAAIAAADADPAVRAVVIHSGVEKFFCAGADIKTFAANSVEANQEMVAAARSALARIEASGNEAVNPLQPYFLVYIREDGEVRYNFTAPKQILEIFRAVCQGKAEPYAQLCELFDQETGNGQDMSRYSALLDKAVAAIAAQFGRKNAGNLFAGRGGKLTDASKQVKHMHDFELITWLVIKDANDAKQ